MAIGAVYGDEYAVPVTGDVDPNSPVLASLYVGFIDPDTQPDQNHPVTARDTKGNEITPFLADIPIASNRAPSLSEFEWTSTEIIFDNTLEISGVAIPTTVNVGDDLTVTLHWTGRATPDADYTAFLHMLDSAEPSSPGRTKPRLEAVSPRVTGGKMTTSSARWPYRSRNLPPAEYELWVGLYETASQGQMRMPITGSGEYLTANDMVSLGHSFVNED